MKKKAIYALILSLLTVPCYAGPIVNAFGPGDTYDTSTGWIVGKSSPFPEDVDSAIQFSFGGSTSYYLDTIELAAVLYSGTNELDVWLMSDAAGEPGAVIEAFNVLPNETLGAFRVSGTAIPAPGAFILGGIGLGIVGWLRRRRTL